MYMWAHMANNVGSAFFGIVYMALWTAAAKGHSVGSYSPRELVGYIAVGQVVLWITTFLPRDLGVSQEIRSGQVALEFCRPMGYLPRTLAGGAGGVLYSLIFRVLPLAAVFTLLGDFPWTSLRTASQGALFLLALGSSAVVGLCLQYMIGLSAFWTVDTRWARRLNFALTMFCGGQLLPISLMPQTLSHVLTWLPFQALVFFPVSVFLGTATLQGWVSEIVWSGALLGVASYLTRRAGFRLQVQGG